MNDPIHWNGIEWWDMYMEIYVLQYELRVASFIYSSLRLFIYSKRGKRGKRGKGGKGGKGGGEKEEKEEKEKEEEKGRE